MDTRNSIFISGAAAGIGRATTLLFLEAGWQVGAYDRDTDGLAKLADDVAENVRERLITGVLDVTENTSWEHALADFAQHNEGKLNLLFNNAGILYSGAFEAISLDAQQRMIEVNVQGVLAGCYLARPYLEAAAVDGSNTARVINMSSASAIYGQPKLAIYSASKFAVRAITEALELEWADQGIKVMDVMPLFVKTAMVADMQGDSMRRLGVRLTPQMIAATVYRMAHYKGSRIHWYVGRQTKLMALASKLSPSWLVRLSNKWISR
ncbi:SDR family oxidoreductase [Pseudidiomarina sp. 1APP75-32.1]|uniref:SDR family oxidoreductase n=1 Tax=Pseudidiomarina terrestris TaxID=2820060 RepID=A0AAW7QYD0_9GAMM|nr:SDR family oxidoreductase [Pseudidiomarina sp. 1APP75-32.1]MDN7124873.1 SDR family oxidoreductase [Pseudidiomarina sp. 1APP75-32.1]